MEAQKRSSQARGRGEKSAAPSVRQEEILLAYVDQPNAAEVARVLGASERNVRRIVQQFGPELDGIRRERYRERLERADAREVRLERWADDSIDAALRRLDELADTADPDVAVRALKMKLDLVQRKPPLMPPNARTLDALDRKLLNLVEHDPPGAQEDLTDG
ncbi:hypothetical protein BH18ACT17_BH18ACT17_08470 [soil metagenome]